MKKFLLKNKKVILTIKSLIGLAILATIYFSIEDKKGLLEAFYNANWVNLFLAFLLIFVNIAFQFLKYFKLLKAAGIKVNAKQAFGSLMFGFTLGFITPGNIGELGRAIYFKNLNRWEASGAVLVDKLVNMITVYFIGSITLIFLMLNYSNIPVFFAALYISIFVFSFLLFLFFLWNPYFFFYIARKLKLKLKIQKQVLKVVKAVDNISSKSLLIALTIAVLWVGVITMQYHMVLLGFINISVVASFLAVPSMLMIKMALPVTVGDIGIREGALIFCYSFFTGSKEVIIYTGLIVLIYNMIVPALAGAFLLKNVKFDQSK